MQAGLCEGEVAEPKLSYISVGLLRCVLSTPTGILLAKCLQDNRLIDMPLSRPFLKLMCMGEVGYSLCQQFGDITRTPSTLGESWHSESSDLIASIEEVEKEMKLENDVRKF